MSNDDYEPEADEAAALALASESDPAAGAADTPDDLAWLTLEVQKAQRQIARGASAIAEGIVGLSVALLEIRRRRLYRFDPEAYCARSFETFVAQRFGISERSARQYTDALASLGEAQYHALLRDVGVQRTFALALLNQAEPTLVEAFQMLPAEERQAVTVAQIGQVTQALVPVAGAEVERRLAQLEQELGRSQGLLQQSQQRLREIEGMHQRTAQLLIDERDAARQDAEQQQHELERLRALLRQAQSGRTATSDTPPRGEAAPAAPEPQASSPQSIVVVMPCDVAALVVDVRALSDKLERLAQINPADVPPEQRRELASGLQQLARLVATLLGA